MSRTSLQAPGAPQGAAQPLVPGTGTAPPLLPLALPAQRVYIGQGGASIALYAALLPVGAPGHHRTPLVLLHSVNAAASAAEVRPIFDAVLGSRPVVAVELPGFGSSARQAQAYTPTLMTDALLRAVAEVRRLTGSPVVDLLAVSLSCEFAARAALSRPDWFRTLSLVSPTGLETRQLEAYEDGRTKDKPWLRGLLERGPWGNALFRLLTSERVMRKFLQGTWGERRIDETLLAYNLRSVGQPGARHAPFAFIAGALFTRGAAQLYARLPQPVWVAHGIHGRFNRFDGLQTVQRTSRWQVDAFDTGAMPYFQAPDAFMACHQRFVDHAPV